MYHTILTAVVILFPLVSSIEDVFSLTVHRVLWITALAVVFACHAFFNLNGLLYQAGIAALSFCFYYLIRFLTKKGLGFADVLMGAFMGSVLSLEKMIYAVIFQIVLSLLIFALFCLFTRKKSCKIPFIPVMAASLWLFWFN